MTTEKTQKIVILATGGTIAGLAPDPRQPATYQAAVLSIDDLLAGLKLPPDVQTRLSACTLVSEQVAQIDSKAMTHAIWHTLAQRCEAHLQDADVKGVVITHGTDTVEETAFFLDCVLKTTKPVALTCAMLPANAPHADGPANLADALSWVAFTDAGQVALVVQGEVHAAPWVQKTATRLGQAFSSGRHPAVTVREVLAGQSVAIEPTTTWAAPPLSALPPAAAWPHVVCVTSHAGVDGRLVQAMMGSAHPPAGWVVAATGAGTVHPELQAALLEAQAQGATVWCASRCVWGEVPAGEMRDAPSFHSAGMLSPTKARIALMLSLMCR